MSWRQERIRHLPASVGAPTYASGGNVFYLGNGSAFEVEARRGVGELVWIIRWGGYPSAITRDDVARFDLHRGGAT
jgi:hypothetical protein